MKCNIDPSTQSVYTELVKKLSNNKAMALAMYFNIHNEQGNVSEEFLSYFKDKTGRDYVDVMTSDNATEEDANVLYDYYLDSHKSVERQRRTAQNIYIADYYGYNFVSDRDAGKQFAADIMLDFFISQTEKFGKGFKHDFADYRKNLRQEWVKNIFNYASTLSGKSIDVIKNGFKKAKDKASYIESILGGNDMTGVAKNLYAVYKELNGSPDHVVTYIMEVLQDSKLNEVYNAINGIKQESIQSEPVDSAADLNGIENEEDSDNKTYDPEDSITVMNSHGGHFTSFTKHLTPRLRNYFNSLYAISNDNDIESFVTNNTFGLPERMDAAACTIALYNGGPYASVKDLKEAVLRISQTLPGFEAFKKLAEDIGKDNDFAQELLTTFSKAKIVKKQVRIKNGKVEVFISNTRSNPQSQFTFDCLNDLRTAVIGIDHYDIHSSTKEINDEISDIKAKLSKAKNRRAKKTDESFNPEEEIKDLTSKIIPIIRAYFPSVSERSINAFITLNGKTSSSDAYSNKISNIERLNTLIDNIARTSLASYESWNTKQVKLSQAKQHNASLDKDKAKGNWHYSDEYEDTNAILAKDFIDESQNQYITAFVNTLLAYVPVNTSLNSTNAEHNQASDVINNSFITRNNDIFDSTDKRKTKAYGQKKFRSKHIKYNNLLSEHSGVNKGVFVENDGNVEVVDRETSLLHFDLFDGTQNEDTDEASTYAKMNSGDYGPSVLSAFFKGDDSNSANYFLRIPSDAPKTYMMRAPRYDTKGLYYTDKVDEDQKIQGILNALPRWSRDYLKSQIGVDSVIPVTGRELVSTMTNDKPIWIRDMKAVKAVDGHEELKSGDEVYVFYVTNMAEETDSDEMLAYKHKYSMTYVVKGVYNKVNNGNMLENPEVVSIDNTYENNTSTLNYAPNVKEQLENHYRELLKQGDVYIGDKVFEKTKRKINRNHPVYKQLINIRKGELLDMAVAMDGYLELFPSGDVKWKKGKDGKPELPFKRDKRNNKGYKFFHLGESGLFADYNGEVFELNGNVFRKSKFQLYNDTDGSVDYMTDTMSDDIATGEDRDGKIHILYGGANNGLRTIRNEAGDLVDIELTSEQEEVMYEAIDKFITDFAERAIEEGAAYDKYVDAAYRGADNRVELALNYFVTMASMDDILEGSTNCYKDIQTFFKRTKEGQGSGTPQGNVDFNTTDVEVIEDIPDSFIEKGTYTTLNEEGQLVEVSIHETLSAYGLGNLRQRTGFRGVTIKNSIQKAFASLPGLRESLVAQYIKAGLDEETAKNKANDILYGPIVTKNGKVVIDETTQEPKRRGGFQDTKVNDAQSYITFEEWIRRVANRGQLRRYMPLIEKILDENSVITAEDIDEFVQVQKNFYFDLHYDERYGREFPRQIKNAEFVLVPRFIRGTQLQEVYQMMKDSGIDQLNTVETSKAANEELLTIWDNDGNIQEKDKQDFINRAAELSQIYDYKYLYTQQDTSQHMNDENKAGVQIVKKLIDNIPADHPMRQTADEFFRLFVANIKDSFEEVVNKLEIARDKDGKFILEEGSGRLEGINKKVFFDKIREEMRRQGLDNNMLDFVDILDGNGEPNMPAITPNVLSKFESVVQAVFNNNITRQKLPGFHAAQVTNIGFKSIRDTGITGFTYDKDLKYHPDGKGYIEIMVPASIFKFNRYHADGTAKTMEELLKEMQDEHLDEIVGYRIPTEGKQSVCNMKIVGLLDDSYGSTIVVPNEWVAQTGSDFDIDSVYAIQAESYIDKEGKLRKIKYKTIENKANISGDRVEITSFDKYDYIKYVKRAVKSIREEKASSYRKEAIQKVRKAFDDAFDKLKVQETLAYHNIKDIEFGGEYPTIGDLIKAINAACDEQVKDLSKKEAYLYRLGALVETLSETVNDNIEFFSVEDLEKLQAFISANDAIIHQIASGYEEYTATKEDALSKAELDYFNTIEAAAKDAGILSFVEWSALSEEEKNSRAARNSHILDCMWAILDDPTSLEENLSRSNFDDITAVLNSDYLPSTFKAARSGRTAYNIWDQIRFQEDAMSGVALKGISVALDGFCSICNRVQANVEENNQITVVYNEADIDKADAIEKRFNKTSHNKKEGTIKITHDTYGWTKDNRSVVGKILTAYSSQTTAYILDAIKEGSIPNVNIYTFTTYKTFLNMGVDYKTAISFMMQPGVSRIVENYTANKSLFGTSVGNPIHMAIKDIAKELGLNVNSRTSIGLVLKQLNAKFGDKFNELLNIGNEKIKISLKQDEAKNIPIIVSKLTDRLNDKGDFSSPVKESRINQLVFDLGIILTFNKIRNTANEISQIARTCNPDKFGAKATVYETRKVFEDIRRCMYNDDRFNLISQERPKVLTAKNKAGADVHILEAIYPGVENGLTYVLNNMNPNDSAYPSLAAFLKYSTAFSIACAQNVLPTENEHMVSAINGLASMLSGLNPSLDETEYNNFKRYLLAYFFNNTLSIAHPMTYKVIDGQSSYVPDHNADAFEEKQRVFGYSANPDLRLIVRTREQKSDGTYRTVTTYEPVEVQDIYNPTEEEINNFNKLSPAQKVNWIKEHFEDSGIFKYFKTNLINVGTAGTYRGMQTIAFTDDSLTANVGYELFLQAFTSDNPLIKLTAIDIIKYAVQVDGYKMTKTGVNKVIDNAALYMPITDGGMGIVDEVIDMMAIVNYYFNDSEVGRNIYEQYLRTALNPNIHTLRLTHQNKEKYNYQHLAYGIYYIANEGNIEEYHSKLAEAGIMEEPLTENGSYKLNQYIYTKNSDGEITLYRIKEGNFGVYFYPLNPLQPNETSEYSANPKNNEKYPHKDGLELFIQKIEDERVKGANEITMELASKTAEDIDLRSYYKNLKTVNKDALAQTFNLETLAKEEGSGMWQAKKKISEHFANNVIPLYLSSVALNQYIQEEGYEYGSQQKVRLEDGTYKDVYITKYKLSRNQKRFLNGELNDVTRVTDNKTLQFELQKAKARGAKDVDVMYEVREIVDDSDPDKGVMTSGIGVIDNLNSDGLNYLRLRVMSGNDEEAVSIIEKLKRNGVNTSLVSVKENQGDVVRELARYALKASESIRRQVEHFVKDPDDDDKYLSISDKKVQNMLLKDKNLTEEYLRVINEARAFLNSFKGWTDFRVETDDEAMQIFVKDIVKAYETVERLPDITEAEENFARGFVKEISDNPVIQNELVDILTGFHKTYGTMWRFHDVLENGTPLLQTILKDVNGNIEARRIQTEKFIKGFRNDIAKIIEEAEANGVTVDFSKFISDTGRFTMDFIKEFADTLEELRQAVLDASTDGNNHSALGSVDHLTAKNQYDAFKANYVHQPAKQEYYLKKVNLEKQMLDTYPELYSKYMTLWYKSLDIYRYISDNGLNDALESELDSLQDKMINLIRPEVYVNEDGDVIDRRTIAEDSDDYKIYGEDARTALNDFLYETRKLQDEYFEKKPVHGFEQQLKENLKIIHDLEERDAKGIPNHTEEWLMSHEEYRRAKKWIKENAKFQIDYEKLVGDVEGLFSETDGEDATSVGDYVQKLLNVLKVGRNARPSVYSRLAKEHKIHDEYGIPDGNKLSKEEREEIRKVQESLYRTEMFPPFSDQSMISSTRNSNRDIYNSSFYNNMKSDGAVREEWVEATTKLNSILKKYYDNIDGIIHFERIPDTEEGREEMKTLTVLYYNLHRMRKRTKGEEGSSVGQFIEENVEFVPDTEAYKAQWLAAKEQRSGEWIKLWNLINSELDDDGHPIQMKDSEGNPVVDRDGHPVYEPNRLIYGYMKPKGHRGEPEYDRWVDSKKTEAMFVVGNLFKKSKTRYYTDAMRTAQTNPQALGYNSRDEWYEANHIYNPYTHTVEPIECWLASTYNEDVLGEIYNLGEWVPKGSQYDRVARDGDIDGIYIESEDKRDPDYVENGTLMQNYIKGANDGRFDDKTELNQYERAVRETMQKALSQFALSPKSQRFFNQGYLPAEEKPDETTAMTFVQEMFKLLGLNVSSKNSDGKFKEKINYETDYIPDIPMTTKLQSKEAVELKEGETVDDYPNQTIKIPTKPKRSEFNTQAEYYQALAGWNKLYRQIKDHNDKVHGSLLNKDNWVDNIANFITLASSIKAVQENKQILYYLHNMLEKMDYVTRKYGIYGDLKKDEDKSSDNNPVYATTRDKELVEHYDNYLKRLFFEMYQEPTGRLTTIANALQNFTSANYMMLNIRGGIANITYGETQILAEAAAEEYFGAKHWAQGTLDWTLGAISFCSNMYRETSTTVQDAIIKYCNIVDYDEINGVVRTVDFKKYSERLRNWMFSPQTVGEHFMQNSILFAMLHSHKIVEVPEDKTGINYTYMNEAEYIRYRLSNELVDKVFTPEQVEAFNAEKKRISDDLNEAKEYAWFRRDILNNFVYLHCDKEQQNKFLEIQKDLTDKYKEEFNNLEDMYSQLELGEDGRLAFKDGSRLSELDSRVDAKGISYANNIMGRFIHRARSVNNKIHGVYNRKGAAYIERFWIGRLIMQYHKHIPIGLLKRYRVRGLFNEARGTVEKGTYTTLWDFLTMPIDKIKYERQLSTDEKEALEGIQNIFKNITDYLINIPMAFKLLPAYERANMRRKLANCFAVLGALALTMLLQIFGDDDDDDSIPYNLALYELDRLASETFYYTPIGIGNETKKLMSTPIAAQSIVNDAFKTMAELASLMLSGEDSGFYQSGRFAGQSKYRVFLERRLPGWAGIKAILDTPKNNHYFKLGQNPIGIFNVKEKAQSIKEYFDIRS